jgi:four helix bundle protein
VVPSNIAEGKGRSSDKEILHHARGSLLELETQVLIARKQGYLRQDHGQELAARTEELARMLNGLINSTCKGTAT